MTTQKQSLPPMTLMTFSDDGPHVVTGPIAIEDAEPGDVLKVEVLELEPRVPYGVISNRHYKGALPEEFPKLERLETASVDNPEAYGDVSGFCPIHQEDGVWYGGGRRTTARL